MCVADAPTGIARKNFKRSKQEENTKLIARVWLYNDKR